MNTFNRDIKVLIRVFKEYFKSRDILMMYQRSAMSRYKKVAIKKGKFNNKTQGKK